MTHIIFKPYKPICSLYNWTETNPSETAVRVSTPDGKYHYYPNDNQKNIRMRLLGVFALNIFAMPLVRFPSRVYYLLTGSWVCAGKEKANQLWIRHCIDTHRGLHLPPFKYKQIATLFALNELVADVIKCATLPIAMAGLFFATAWGLVNAYDAGRLVGRIEDAWSIQIPEWKTERFYQSVRESGVNHFGKCLLDVETLRRKNLYRLFMQGQHPYLLRSLIYSLKRLDDLGIGHVNNFSTRFPNWMRYITSISENNFVELDEEDNLILGIDAINDCRHALRTIYEKSIKLNEHIVASSDVFILAKHQKLINEINEAVELMRVNVNK